jgi:transposase InsO family protein
LGGNGLHSPCSPSSGRRLRYRTLDQSKFRASNARRWLTPRAGSYIALGKPMQNGFIESLNGSFRDECLDETLFTHG